MFFFFFSSRRRHTRLTCDWSSDVCSSDLDRVRDVRGELDRRRLVHGRRRGDHPCGAGAPGPRLSQGGRRSRPRGGGCRRPPGRGGPRSGRADPPRLAGPDGVGALDALDAGRADVPRARRAARALLVMLDLADLDRARKRLEGAIYESPCPYSQTLSELSGTRCFVKLENLQMTGSFKERGAANLLLQLDAAERARG